MSLNTTGYKNVANGSNALYSNTTGSNNAASGSAALYNNSTGGYNTALGVNSLPSLNSRHLGDDAVSQKAFNDFKNNFDFKKLQAMPGK